MEAEEEGQNGGQETTAAYSLVFACDDTNRGGYRDDGLNLLMEIRNPSRSAPKQYGIRENLETSAVGTDSARKHPGTSSHTTTTSQGGEWTHQSSVDGFTVVVVRVDQRDGLVPSGSTIAAITLFRRIPTGGVVRGQHRKQAVNRLRPIRGQPTGR